MSRRLLVAVAMTFLVFASRGGAGSAAQELQTGRGGGAKEVQEQHNAIMGGQFSRAVLHFKHVISDASRWLLHLLQRLLFWRRAGDAAALASSGNSNSNSSGSSSGSSSFSNSAAYANLAWNGVRVTKRETESLDKIKSTLSGELAAGRLVSSSWLQSATDSEFLRFLRHHNGNKDAASKSIKAHAAWRTSAHGSETILRTKHAKYSKHVLNREIFWLGVSKGGCPTLVIRSRAHDGADYENDPHVFVDFVVWVLEQGKAKYGNQPICMILDRGTFYRNGKGKGDRPDFSVIPQLVKLLKLLFSTITNNYPEILSSAKVVPSNFFFKMCYRVTSRVMDKKERDRFFLLPGPKVAQDMLSMFPASVLPPHMGGTSTRGGLWDDGQWDRPEAVEEALSVLRDDEAQTSKGKDKEGPTTSL